MRTSVPGSEDAAPARDPRPRRLSAALSAAAPTTYGLLTAALLATFVLAAHFLTLEADEAWILLSAANAFGVPVPPTDALGNPTVTTGGAYLLVQGSLARLTMALWVHRAASLLATAALLALGYAALRWMGHSRGRALAGTALMAATPGFALQAGLATGEVIAVLLLFAAGIAWVRTGAHSIRGAANTGLLLGLACATRVNCAAAVLGFLAFALAAPGPTLRRLVLAVMAAALAAASAGLMVAGYYLMARTIGAAGQGGYLSASTGVGAARKSVFQFIRYLVVANQYLPVLLLAAIATGWGTLRFGQTDEPCGRRKVHDVAGLFLFMGVAMLVAWIVVAPIPHLRYLWPAVACCWFAGIVVLAEAWRAARSRPVIDIGIHAGVLATCGYAMLSTLAIVAAGESLVLVYQANGVAPAGATDWRRRFTAASDQRALSAFMAGRPADARFFAYTSPTGYPLSYLSGRVIEPTAALGGTEESYLITQPADFALWRSRPAAEDWRRRHAALAFRRGGMAAWRIQPGAPVPPAGIFLIGQNDLS